MEDAIWKVFSGWEVGRIVVQPRWYLYESRRPICRDRGEKRMPSCVGVHFLEHGDDTAPRGRVNGSCNLPWGTSEALHGLNKGPHPHGRKRTFTTFTVETSTPPRGRPMEGPAKGRVAGVLVYCSPCFSTLEPRRRGFTWPMFWPTGSSARGRRTSNGPGKVRVRRLNRLKSGGSGRCYLGPSHPRPT